VTKLRRRAPRAALFFQKQIALCTSLVLILLLATSGCRLPGSTPAVVKIGLTAPFEGLYRPLGYDALYGVKLAIRERNSAGGVGGALVELVALDDHFDPQRAVSVAREMAIDPDVMGVIGPLSGTLALAVQEEYQRAGLAFITLAGDDTLTSGGSDVTFRLAARDADLGACAARYALDELAAQRLAVVYPAPDAMSAAFCQAVQEAGADLAWQGTPSGQWLTALQDAAPDVILIIGDSVTGAKLARKIREVGLTATLMGGQSWATPHLSSVGGEAVENALYVTSAPAPQDLEAEAFIADYQALAGFPPGPYGAWAYDATQALLAALEQTIHATGRPTRTGVAAQLRDLSACQGLSGPIAFDEFGNRQHPPLYIYRLEGSVYPGRLIWHEDSP